MIMEAFSLPPCKTVGDIKDAIKDAIIEGKIENTYEAAWEFAIQKAGSLGLNLRNSEWLLEEISRPLKKCYFALFTDSTNPSGFSQLIMYLFS